MRGLFFHRPQIAFSRAYVFCLLILCLLVSQSRAAAAWTLTDSDFNSRSVSIDSIDSAGIHTGTEIIPWNHILEISQSVTPRTATDSKLYLLFRGGDKLAGSPVSFDGDTLQWNSSRLGPISFSASSLIGIVPANYAGSDLNDTRTDDVVHLANGDSLHGIVNQISPTGVTMQIDQATPTLAWDSISAVIFSTPKGNPAALNNRMFRIRLAGDESLTCSELSLASNQFTLTFPDKTTRQIDANAVSAVEQENGPIAWLTSLTPAQNIYKPFFSENFPAQFDRTVVDGKPITEKYPAFHHGIGCHSYSKLVYNLDGKFAAFRGQFVIDSDSPLADVTVRIYLDDAVAFERKNVKSGSIYPVVTLPLKDAKTISLEVDYGDNYATEDRFVWLDPALWRTLPEVSAQPTTMP